MVHQKPLNSKCYKLHNIFMIFDGLTNDNKIIWNLNYRQSLSKRTYIWFFFLFLTFFCIYLEIQYQDCQDNPLSSDLFPDAMLPRKWVSGWNRKREQRESCSWVFLTRVREGISESKRKPIVFSPDQFTPDFGVSRCNYSSFSFFFIPFHSISFGL
jgi:hypothetical protein